MRKDRVVSEVFGEESAITPSDLYNAEFHTQVVGGYDKVEVDAFLERVGDVLESLIREVRDLKAQVQSQKEEIETLREMENSLRNALVTAQKFSEETLVAAKRQAAAILEEARLARARAEHAASELPKALRVEIAALQAARDRLRDDLEAVVEAHAALVARIPRAEHKMESRRVADADDVVPEPTRPAGKIEIEREPPWLDSTAGDGDPPEKEAIR